LNINSFCQLKNNKSKRSYYRASGLTSTIQLKKIIFIPSLLLTVKLVAQRPHTGMWLNAQLPVSLSKKWQWHNDASYRTLGTAIAPLQYEYRTGIRYHFNTVWSVTAGTAFFFTRNGFSKQQDEFAKERRMWQELAFKKNMAPAVQLYIRLRSEERNFAATSTKNSYHAFRWRIRTQLQQQLSRHWALQLADEYMQQYIQGNGSFDQNRLLCNAVYSLQPHSSIAAGYMWLRWPAAVSQHILNISFQKNISLHGKQ
jgi:Protein of unknown function (DUF2490)